VCFPHFTHPTLADALEEPVPPKDGTRSDGDGGGRFKAGCHGIHLEKRGRFSSPQINSTNKLPVQ
jgi:hypothetical protein